jgi:hypothetical protein
VIKRNVKSALAFIATTFIGALLFFLTDASCSAISNYYWIVQFGIAEIILGVGRIFLIFIVGMVLFLIVKRKINKNKYDKIKLMYFAVLPFFIFYSEFLRIPMNLMNRSVVNSICAKSSFDGIQTESHDLNLKEYRYLQGELFLLPDIPKSSDKIGVRYSHDDFFGEFSLHVQLLCSKDELIDTTQSNWSIKEDPQSKNIIQISYFERQD